MEGLLEILTSLMDTDDLVNILIMVNPGMLRFEARKFFYLIAWSAKKPVFKFKPKIINHE
jgi:hypothetical protein